MLRLFRSTKTRFVDAITTLQALRDEAEQKRDSFLDASRSFADQAMDHDDIAFTIEQMIGPKPVDVPEAPELTDSEDDEEPF